MSPLDQPLNGTTVGGGDAAAIIDAAREYREVLPEFVKAEPNEVLIVRNGEGDPTIIDIDWALPRPRRAMGVYQVGSLDSLIALTERIGVAEETTVWVHPTSGRVEVVFDDHDADQAGHGEHRAVLQLAVTPAWRAWLALDGKLIGQQEFAEHIEARVPDIASPPAADLAEVVSTLTGHTEVSWKSGVRLQDGTVQMQYTEEATATAGRYSELSIPQTFTLVLQPFVGLSRGVPITARFRYRVRSGTVAMGYVLDQPERVLEDAVANVHRTLAEKFGRVYMGAPR